MNRVTILFIGILIGFLSEYFFLPMIEKQAYLVGCSEGVIEISNSKMFRTKPRFCEVMYNGYK